VDLALAKKLLELIAQKMLMEIQIHMVKTKSRPQTTLDDAMHDTDAGSESYSGR